MIQRRGKIIRILVLVGCFFCTGVLAQNNDVYTTKEPIPGAEPTSNLTTYLGQLYTFGIAAAVFLAMFMVGLGAFLYTVTSAGNVSKMGNAKEMIYNAIYGLILALLAYLILNVINPDLLRGDFHLGI